MFPICKQQKNSTDTYKCCLNNCKQQIDYCYNYCKKQNKEFLTPELIKRCLNSCDIFKQNCIETCKLSAPDVGINSSYNKCSQKYGCKGLYDLPVIECIKKNKNEILKCCKNTCQQSPILDCQKNCDFLHKLAVNEHDLFLPTLDQENIHYTKKQNYLKIILIIIGILSIIIIIFFLIK